LTKKLGVVLCALFIVALLAGVGAAADKKAKYIFVFVVTADIVTFKKGELSCVS